MATSCRSDILNFGRRLNTPEANSAESNSNIENFRRKKCYYCEALLPLSISPEPLRCFMARATRVLLCCLMLLLPKLAWAQIDKEFWFVAPNVHNEGSRQFNLPINLRITSQASAANVVVSMPADPSFAPITRNVGSNQNISIDLSAWVNQLQNTPANAVLNKGLLITSNADITAYYEVVSGVCNCNPEIFSLKGKNALGKEFFISSQYSYDESTAYPGTNAFDIVASEDNTQVTITPAKNILGHNANIPFTVTLNKGQTFSAEAVNTTASGHLQGSYVTADKPIAITIKDDLVQVSSCADLIGDQTVPTNVLGREYIVTKGFLQPIDNVYITATADNTSIFENAGASAIKVLNKGESTILDLSNPSVYIRADKNIYVYHLTGNGCEAGSAIIPKLNCTGSKSVSVVRSNGGLFAVLITTKNGNQNGFTVNGNSSIVKASDFSPVTGTGGAYVTARVDLSGSAAVGQALNFLNSTGNFSLGFLNGGTNDGTRYGFFSDYKSSDVRDNSVETCPGAPVELNAYGGVSYKWSPAAGLNNANIANPMASPVSTTDYTVEITTADGCVDFATVHVLVSGGITPSVSISAFANNACPGTLVTFTAAPVNGGATPVYQWQINGVNTGTNSPTFSSSTFTNGDKVSCRMTSSAPCANSASVTSNIITVAVVSVAPVTVSIAESANNICAGTELSFTATVSDTGLGATYQWHVNGVNAGENNPVFISSALLNSDKISCTVTVTGACGTPAPVASNIITMVVNPALPASVSISVSQNNVCIGTTVTFTATAVNGGTAPNYRWVVNGVYYGDDAPTFSKVLTDKDRVTCMLWSNATCAAPVPAISNAIIMQVNPDLTPQVSIAASTNNICPGDEITFIATAVDAGLNPIYQWKINGGNIGTNSATFTAASFVNGDVINCVVTSNAPCPTTPTATSGSITLIVNTSGSSSVSISASANNICAGTTVTFTATPINGGLTPTYQWMVNRVNAGNNSNTFTSSTLINNDVVTCSLTSSAKCIVPATATSNPVTMLVNPALPVSVNITASRNNVCVGSPVTFTAAAINGGSLPAYQWLVNGSNAGANTSTFASTTLANGDVITCRVISNAKCAVPVTATSNSINMLVNPYLTPLVSITSSANNICPGDMVSFTAIAQNAGPSPDYQWLLNGANVGFNSNTFSGNTFIQDDVVTCVITSNAVCTTAPTAGSNGITINVNQPVTPSVSIAASANEICYGTEVTFTATTINGGNPTVFQWLLNGLNTGGNRTTFTSSTLSNSDIVSCRITSNAKCAVPAIVSSNDITMIVNPLPVVDGGGDKIIEKGISVTLNASSSVSPADITWSPAAGLDNAKRLTPIANPDKTTTYTLIVQTAKGCVGVATVKVTVQSHLIIPSAITPNSDGINDKWEIGNLSDYPEAYVRVYNRWGTELYKSAKGGADTWNGTWKGKPLPPGTYYYIINLDKSTPPITGYVVILR